MVSYLHVRILLYRPALSNFAAAQDSQQQRREGSDSTLSWYLRFRSSVSCVQAAIDAIQMIQSHLPTSINATGLLPAWWYNVLYIYTAATVLLAAIRSPALEEEFLPEYILESWRSAVVVLRRYRAFSPSVRKSITALEMLFDQITPRDLETSNHPDRRRKLAASATERSPPSQTEPSMSRQSKMTLPTTEITNYPDPGMNSHTVRILADSSFTADDDPLNLPWSQEHFDISFDISDLSWLNSLPHNL
jgi:hypothetical protein